LTAGVALFAGVAFLTTFLGASLITEVATGAVATTGAFVGALATSVANTDDTAKTDAKITIADFILVSFKLMK